MKDPKNSGFWITAPCVFYLIFFSGCFFIYACSNGIEKMDTDSLEKKLIETGFGGLFLHGSNSLADSIWDNGKNLPILKQIIQTPTRSLHGKFLAAEMLRHFDAEFDPQNQGELVDAYIYALKSTSSERSNPVRLNGNLWGLLNIEDDAGHLGQQILQFGHAAIPALTELLDDDAGRFLYEG